jgi:hypothetical protein
LVYAAGRRRTFSSRRKGVSFIVLEEVRVVDGRAPRRRDPGVPDFSCQPAFSQHQHMHDRPLPFSTPPLYFLSGKEQQCRPLSILSGKKQQCGGSNRARDAPYSRLPPHGTPACLPPSARYAASSCERVATLLRTAQPTASDARDGDGTAGGSLGKAGAAPAAGIQAWGGKDGRRGSGGVEKRK